ncbi:hypothetical protein CB1_000871008 [Camelus ferus]|nr:hypothetical protein CB1_000871008 [Camelus ferus]
MCTTCTARENSNLLGKEHYCPNSVQNCNPDGTALSNVDVLCRKVKEGLSSSRVPVDVTGPSPTAAEGPVIQDSGIMAVLMPAVSGSSSGIVHSYTQ